MQHSFKAVSLTYKNSPVFIREKVALNATESTLLLNYIRTCTSAQDVLVLSTCNRTEIYYAHQEDISITLIMLLGIVKGLKDIANYDAHFIRFNQHAAAMRHLFEVAVGLDSHLIGDMQITHQVKQAYNIAIEARSVGPFLHRLMHTVFSTHKRVVIETNFRHGAASVSYAATQLVMEMASSFTQPKILILGTGKMGTDLCNHLAKSKKFCAEITLSNRTLDKAQYLAQKYDFQYCSFNDIKETIDQYDIIVSAAQLSELLITQASLKNLAKNKRIGFIDLSMPRSIEPSLLNREYVSLYNIDDIHHKVQQAMLQRTASIPRVKKIIEESLLNMENMTQEMELSPIIQSFKDTLEQIRQHVMKQ